jgi:hypothetical protein
VVLNLLKVAAVAALRHADLSRALAGGEGGGRGGGGRSADIPKEAVRCLRGCFDFFLGGGKKGSAGVGKVMDVWFRLQVHHGTSVLLMFC